MFANQPSPQTAVKGSTVVLPCRVLNKVGTLQWTKDDFGLGNERELYDYQRYTMIGSDEEGDYSLRISPVTLEDDAYFQCQVTGYQDIPGVRSRTAKLTVTVPPNPPDVQQGPIVSTRSGAPVQLTCISDGGKPAAEIQWLDGTGREVTDGIEYRTEIMDDGQRYNAKSTLSFLAAKTHHNSVFTCTSSNPALHRPLTTQVRLEVSYPPEVSIKHDKDGYKEGQSATLTCTAQANPSQITYRWYRNGQEIPGNNTTKLVIKDVTTDNNLEDITCEASNKIGPSSKITRLSVHYGPSFRVPPTDQYAEVDENVTLSCHVDSNPHPTIVWINQKTQTLVGTGEELRLRVSKQTVGSYQCIAKVEGFPEISETVGVFLKGPPQVKCERLQSGRIGDMVTLQCIVTSASPRSLNVTWAHQGKLVDIDDRRFEMSGDITSHGLRHTLVIHSARQSDFGAYKFSVHNEYGSDIFEVILNKKKTLPLMVILCGVAGGIVFVLIAAVIVIVYVKKSATNNNNNKDTKSGLPNKPVAVQMNGQNYNGQNYNGQNYNGQNYSGNESDIKVELEQRTGSSLSNNDGGDMEGGWGNVGEKDGVEHISTPNMLPSTHPYLYPDAAYTGLSLKLNGHLKQQQYDNYDQHIPYPHHTSQPPPQQQPPTSPSRGYGVTMRGYNSKQPHPYHQNYEQSEITHDPYSYEGYPSNHTSTLPLSHHLTSRGVGGNLGGNLGGVGGNLGGVGGNLGGNGGNLGGNIGGNLGGVGGNLGGNVGGNLGGNIGPGGIERTAHNNTMPRLGIPIDTSLYIVPPRTEVMSGALATHV